MIKKINLLILLITISMILLGCSSFGDLQVFLPVDTAVPEPATPAATPTLMSVTPDTRNSVGEMEPTATSEPEPVVMPSVTVIKSRQISLPAISVYLDREHDPGVNQEEMEYEYQVQIGSPAALPNFSDPEQGCSWMGIGGQVLTRQGVPIPNIVVEAGGTLEDNDVFSLSLTGLASQFGEGGYELYLADEPIFSQGTVWVELYNLTGEQLAERIYIDTFDDCSQNLLILNYIAISSIGDNPVFLPSIYNNNP